MVVSGGMLVSAQCDGGRVHCGSALRAEIFKFLCFMYAPALQLWSKQLCKLASPGARLVAFGRFTVQRISAYCEEESRTRTCQIVRVFDIALVMFAEDAGQLHQECAYAL